MKQSENANDPTKKEEKTYLFWELVRSSDFWQRQHERASSIDSNLLIWLKGTIE